ncbi:MAG TPA: DUF5107 domain-containing protein, partial [Chloroflexi bacterium]|nr:DUF5107 domain-containing protein [Chloroflexota bacterium]
MACKNRSQNKIRWALCWGSIITGIITTVVLGWLYAFSSSTSAWQLPPTYQAFPPTEEQRMTAPSDVQVRFETVVISTYPYAEYLTTVQDPVFGIPYRKLNWAAYEGSHPVPSPREYTLIVLENEYLRVSLLPELGGRVYQIIFKPTGNNVLYQNPVLKPTHWGPSDQGWWLAAGGIEWCFPVDEHGYEWGEPWSTEIVTSTQGVTVTVRDTTADR